MVGTGVPTPSNARRSRGFTLVELMSTLAIAAIVLTQLVPPFQGLVQDSRRAARVNALLTGLSQARAKSIYSGHNVILCPSTDGVICAKTPRWDQGWIVYLDRNADGTRTPDETVLRHQQPMQGGAILTSKARTRITFRSAGTRLNPGSSAGSNATFTFCDPRGPEHIAAVILSNTGRPRTVNPAPAAIAARCSK